MHETDHTVLTSRDEESSVRTNSQRVHRTEMTLHLTDLERVFLKLEGFFEIETFFSEKFGSLGNQLFFEFKLVLQVQVRVRRLLRNCVHHSQ
jgi:hypothetical protein